MVYFTADMHLGHFNIIRNCNRPYKTVDDMNEAVVYNWNCKVSNSDDVYIIGDMAFRCSNIEEYLKRMKGRKHLIIGNHDDSWMNTLDTKKYFHSVRDMDSVVLNGKEIILCHYPLMEWRNSYKGSYQIFGHIHNTIGQNFWHLIKNNNHMLNAGMEINNYCPVTFEELVENNRIFKSNT